MYSFAVFHSSSSFFFFFHIALLRSLVNHSVLNSEIGFDNRKNDTCSSLVLLQIRWCLICFFNGLKWFSHKAMMRHVYRWTSDCKKTEFRSFISGEIRYLVWIEFIFYFKNTSLNLVYIRSSSFISRPFISCALQRQLVFQKICRAVITTSMDCIASAYGLYLSHVCGNWQVGGNNIGTE